MTKCGEILLDPAASDWLKFALASALKRDPVDAVADAEVLATALRKHCDDSLRSAVEAIGHDLAELSRKPWRDGDGDG